MIKTEKATLDDFGEGDEERLHKLCPKCNQKTTYLKKKSPHIGWYCDTCGWLKWMEQNWRLFKMPFGKYKNKNLSEIFLVDKEYLDWGANNFRPPLKNKFMQALLENYKTNEV